MIVKNEAPVIRRCLDSVRPIIDHWIIVDTGSTDGTQDIIRAAMADLPGTLVERPWVDFAHNRTEALDLARPHGDYTLVNDADDELVVPADFVMLNLDAPGYNLQIHDNTMRYQRTQLFKSALPWHYRGVLHEFAECKDLVWTSTLPITMHRGHDGARRLDKKTFARDAEILEKALTTERDPFLVSRYTFYLAQSYRDCQERHKAIHNYLKRTELGFWTEEIYISFMNAALLMEEIDEPFEKILSTFEKAIAVNPRRVEARFHVSQYCQSKKRYVEGYYYAEAGISLTLPADGLFLEPWMYAYGIQDTFAVHAISTGQYRACVSACLAVLGCPDFPAKDRPHRVGLARKALTKMVDPAWGANHSAYVAVYSPDWQFS
ncbi:glycosyltransferase [Methylobacterium sp. E-066]|uniref:glycosyltransferase n=1 Tax=Methylobacterium sp. E-066 TaxID=2836584 RepID=UPI001FBA9B44|nr:glycosyltransferase [Methylobacterium sp. E-066]MCJ2139906.1 glycosyltransferase [Methylobacterium sp. E-066]